MFSQNLKTALKNKGATQRELAEFARVKPNTVSDWLKQGNSPKLEHLCRISEFLDLSLDLLIKGYDSSTPSGKQLSIEERLILDYYNVLPDEKRIELQKIAAKLATHSKVNRDKVMPIIKENISHARNKPKLQVEMRLYDQKASAGLGNYLNEYGDSEMVLFNEDDVPYNADFGIRISGDSMEPEIQDDSIVWVEERVSINDGDIGIFVLDGEAYCKELCIDHEKRRVLLVSKNKKYKPIILKEHNNLRTIGKVLL